MQNNGQNNQGWRSLLEDDTAFAEGEITATAKVWDALYKRLHPAKKRKRLAYWRMAAGILPLILVTIFLLGKKSIPADNARGAAMITKPPGFNQEGNAKVTERVAASTSTGKETQLGNLHAETTKPRAHHIEKNRETAVNITTAETSVPCLIKPVDTGAVQEESRLPAPVVSTSPAMPRAKLKVVHVNELGDAPEKNQQQNGDYSVIQLGMKSQPVPNTAARSGKIGLNISTSKTSPSN